jgi:CubicO group peptidase (beta-lactamase class C family)
VYAAAANGGAWNGTRILEPATLAALVVEEVGLEEDLVLGRALRRGRGVMLNTDGQYGPGAGAFGHAGAGGSVGFADPHTRVAIGYAMNQMQTNLDGDTRAGRLARAVYASL